MKPHDLHDLIDKEKTQLRQKINRIDHQIMLLLAKRFKLCQKILNLKKNQNEPLLDECRQQEILKRVKNIASSTEVQNFIIQIYHAIFATGLNMFRASLEKKAAQYSILENSFQRNHSPQNNPENFNHRKSI